MPVWLQHTLVLALAAVCLAVVARESFRALRRRASRMAGCGTCAGCASEPRPAEKPAGERVVFLPSDALSARAANRYKH